MKEKSKNKNQKSKLRKPTILNFKFLILNSRKDGFTLIEVLVSLTVLIIGLLGVALMQVVSISGNTFSKEMAVATELGQDMLETLRASTYTATVEDPALAGSVSPGIDHPTAADVANGLSPAVDTDGVPCDSTTNLVDERGLWPAIATTLGTTSGPLLYTRTWSVTDDGLGVGTNMKTITVTVCWKEKGTTERLVTISAVKVRQ